MLYKEEALFMVIKPGSEKEGATIKADAKSELNILLTVQDKTYEV